VYCGGGGDAGNVLHTRISRTRTMKPTIPPPVPYCVALELRVVKSSAIGAAEQRAARQRWRKSENMIVVVVVVVVVDC
jgi:hypothetical protein